LFIIASKKYKSLKCSILVSILSQTVAYWSKSQRCSNAPEGNQSFQNGLEPPTLAPLILWNCDYVSKFDWVFVCNN